MDMVAIDTKAAAVLQASQIQSPFVNVFDIASREGIAVKYRKFPLNSRNVSGFYFSKDKTIYLNVDEPASRQVFTIAHELGHYFLGHKSDEYGVYRRHNVYEGVKHQNESEADYFAASLLMPETMIRDELQKYPFLTSDSTSVLALRFGVSPSAMTRRLKHLGALKK